MATRPIDEKLVVMRLQNDDFKNKATETASIFGKLKQALGNLGNTKLDTVSKEFGNIQKSANNVNMGALSSAVDTISNRFSALGVVATTALVNITNKAVNAGTALMDSLTTQQVRSGFNEYETKIGSIATVLSNTEWAGTGLEDVKLALGELNEYADNTVYSFGQMTENIGRFTSAGVNLEDSTVAIKGLANLAASSGSNVQQLNTAMYQMSQSMSNSSLNLQDWNSLVNAGMAGKKTQDGLLATAKAMGVNVDASKTFRESISDGWLSTEILLETLKKFGNDASMTEAATSVRTFTGMLDGLKEGIGSGWAQSWEIIFGDFEQATIFWTAISNLIGGIFKKQADSRNEMLRNLANSGALEKFGEIIKNIGTPVVQIFKAIGNAFKAAFPPSGSEGIVKVLSGIASLTSKLKMSEATIQNVTTIFKGLFSVFGIIGSVIKILISSVGSLFPSFDSAGGGILSFVAKLAQIPIAINEYLKSGQVAEKVTNVLKSIFGGIGSVLGVVVSAFSNLASVAEQTMSIFAKGDFTEGAIKEDSLIVSALLGIRNAFKWTFDTIASIDYASIWGGFKSFFDGIGNTFVWIKNAGAGILNFFKNLGPGIANNQGWILAGGGLATMAAVIWKAYETFRSVTQPFKSFSKLLESGAGALDNLGDVLDGASGALKAFTLGIHVKSILTIAVAVGILAISLKLLSDLNTQQITNGLYMIVGSLTAVVGALVVMSKWGGGGTLGATLTIVAISVAVSILASAVKKMSDLNYDEITHGLVGVVSILGALTGAIVLMSKFGGSMTVGALQILAIAGAIHILLLAIDKIAGIQPDVIKKGLITLGILLLELGLFIQLASSKNKEFTTGSVGILAIAGAVWIMVQAIKSIADMKPEQLKQGLITIGVILAAVAGFVHVVKDKAILKTATALVLMASALMALIAPILILGNTPWPVLLLGIAAIGVTIGALVLAVSLLKTIIPGMIGAAAAMILFAVAMNLLIVPIAALGAMGWGVIITGIVGMVLALAAIGVTAAVLGFAVIPILAFSVAIMALGVGFSLLAKGLLLLTTLTVAAVTVIVTAIGAFITGFVTLLPAITDLLLKITNAIVEVMVKMTPKIVDAIGRLILAVLLKIKEYVPIFIDIVADTLILILGKLGEFVVKAVQVVLELLVTLINTVAAYIPEFITAATNIILGFLEGMTENIPKVIDAVIVFMITMVTAMADTVEENGPLLINAVLGLMAAILTVIIEAGISTINALLGWIPGVKDATEKIGKTAGKYIEDNFKAVDIATEKGNDFTTGLESSIPGVKAAGEAIAKAGVDGMSSVDASVAGGNFTTGFANGMNNNRFKVKDAADRLASLTSGTVAKKLDMHSPSLVADEQGGNYGQGFANGIAKKEKSVMEAVFGWLPGMDKATTAATKKTEASGEAAGSSGVKGVSKGVKKTAKKQTPVVKKAVTDMAADASKAFKEKMDNVEYKFKMGEINSDQYIAEIKKIRDAYSKYPKLVQEANLQIKKLEEDAVKAREDLRKKELSDSKAWISERKHYNELSLADELEAWERIQKRYAQGTEERKEADREVYTLKNEIHSNLLSLNDEFMGKIEDTKQKEIDAIKAVNDEYDSAFASRKAKYADFTGIFDSVSTKDDVNGHGLLNNIKGQYDTLLKWTYDMDTLTAQGLDSGFMELLREMGPSSAQEISALTTLTEEELQEYVNVWRSKNELATAEATKALTDLRATSDQKISEIRTDSEKQLELYKNEWIGKIKEIKSGTKEQFVSLNADMNSIAQNAMNGLKVGLESKRGEILAVAASIAASIAEVMNATLDIHSPSRVTEETGEFSGDGLIQGMENRAKDVAKGAKNLATTAQESFAKFAQGLELPEFNNELKITAIVEYDKKALDAMNREMIFKPDLSYTKSSINSISDGRRRKTADENQYSNSKTTDNSKHYNPTYHIQAGPTPKEIANETEKVMRRYAYEFGV